MSYRTVFAWLTAGLAFWCTLGEITIVGSPSGMVRVAMLPGWPQLAAALLLSLAAGITLSLERPNHDPASGDPYLPLFVLAVLVVPYLPWLPDAFPAFRLFAGPGRYVIWMIVVSQMIWAFLGTSRLRRVVTDMRGWGPPRGVVACAAVSAIIFGVAAAAVAPSGIHPSGDEPHVLMLARSLWKDADLSVDDNRAVRGTPEFVEAEAIADYVKVGRNGRASSILAVGLPLLIAPIHAVAGYTGVECLILLVAALSAGLMWQWVRRLTGSVSAATFAWAATAISLPFAFNATSVVPAIPAAICFVAALALGPGGSDALASDPTSAARRERWAGPNAIAIGVLAGLLVWLSPEFTAASVALVAVTLRRVIQRPLPSPATRRRQAVMLLAPYLVACGAWMAFNLSVWGSVWPPAQHTIPQFTGSAARRWLTGPLGTVFDQEYGIVAFAPALLLSLTGLVDMWRSGGRARVLAVELACIGGAVFVQAGLEPAWWGDGSMPGRHIAAALLLLGPPIAWRFRQSASAPYRRAVHRMLLLVGLAVSVTAIVAQHGGLLASRQTGVSLLLEYFSPDWNLWGFVPDLVAQPLRFGILQTLVWGLSAAVCCGALNLTTRRAAADLTRSRARRGGAFLRASAAVLATFIVVVAVSPVVIGAALRPPLQPENRPRVRLIDTFDPGARPLALRYDPLSRMDARKVPDLVAFSAVPGSRTLRQPMRLLLNARFILPSGRYLLRLEPRDGSGGTPLSGTLALQFGRIGPPLAEWTVSGGSWEKAFDLPVDASFVGFKASPELDAAVGLMRIRPLAVTPMLDRIATSEVLAAATYGSTVALFHDDVAWVERGGFWLRGNASCQVSLVSPGGRLTGDVTLRFRPGPIDNTIVIKGAGGERRVELKAEQASEIRLSPAPMDGTLRLLLTAEQGWVPAERDPQSGDRRLLACFVDVPR